MSPQLEVTGADLIKALGHIGKAVRPGKKLGQALIGFRDGFLRIELGGVTGKAPATGTWPGEALVPGVFILNLCRQPPSGERLALVVESGELRLKAGDVAISVPCAWESTERPDIFVATNLDLRERYRLSLAHPPGDLERMGVREAVHEAARKAEEKIGRAAAELKGLGITEEAIREFVWQQVKAGKPS